VTPAAGLRLALGGVELNPHVGDAAVSAGVLLSGAVIMFTGWSRLDPIVSLLIVAAILASTWGLLRDSLHLSLDGVPSSVNSSAVMSFLADQRGVTDVHDLHIWALSTTSVALTAHLVVPNPDAEDSLLGFADFGPQAPFQDPARHPANRAGPLRARLRRRSRGSGGSLSAVTLAGLENK